MQTIAKPRLEMVLPWVGKSLLLAPYHFTAAGVTGVVPAGFDIDGLSVPAVFRPIVEPYGRYVAAAAAHDWLYFLGGRTGITREQADRVLWEICRQIGGTIVPREMYNAVRLGGWMAWGKYTSAEWDAEATTWLASGGAANSFTP